jgi:hypothetical protein
MPDRQALIDRYLDFAGETEPSCPLYAEICRGVAGDEVVLELLAGLAEPKQQPNLLLAAVRQVSGTAGEYADFRQRLLTHREAVLATMAVRATQTNEPARCAALYAVLSCLPQPVALLEVGASAGLCLQPDRYRYTFDTTIAGDPASPLTIDCHVDGAAWQPAQPVVVAWRAGLDLNPLSVLDPDDTAWLETLVWPGQEHRRHRLRTAIDIARTDPPRLVRGDLGQDLAALAGQAPPHATLVVFHTAVLYQVSMAVREAFAGVVRNLPGHWISQESPDVLPWIEAPDQPYMYVVALDERAVAQSPPHGGLLRWLA